MSAEGIWLYHFEDILTKNQTYISNYNSGRLQYVASVTDANVSMLAPG